MQDYINGFIEDLHSITGGKLDEEKTEVFINDDESFFKHIEDVENYLHGDQKPIETITGISREQLPPPERLSQNQQAQLSVELELFLRSFHFELDFPQDYPNHLRYSFIRDFWKEAHTPCSSGDIHIEFCSYDKDNCPFEGYCTTCDEFDKIEIFSIPEKLEKLLYPIAQSIDCGQIVYINLDTFETEDVVPDMEDPEEFELNYGNCEWAKEPSFYKWEHTMRIIPLESHESFKIMEEFANTIEDEKLQEQLFYALNHKKPFANFKWKIDHSAHRQNWFNFKQKCIEDHVREIIWSELNKA